MRLLGLYLLLVSFSVNRTSEDETEERGSVDNNDNGEEKLWISNS